MSIPIEKRDLGDGWMLTCRGEDGGDLTLTDLVVKRENLVCQGMLQFDFQISSKTMRSELVFSLHSAGR